MISVIGDVHGHYAEYERMARKRQYTVQLGDLGFKYGCLNNLDPAHHKIVAGNHDNYDIITEYPHYLGNFGNCSLGGVNFFFYRGAYSIDRDSRTIGLNWWPQEENKIEAFLEARELYRETKPNIVITHCCPYSVIPHFLDSKYAHKIYNTITDWALEELWNIHKPALWIFGHYHVSRTVTLDSTRFICLNELEVMNLD
jgi:predicted phosphodiesterase